MYMEALQRPEVNDKDVQKVLELHVYNDDKEASDVVSAQFLHPELTVEAVEKHIERCLKNAKYLKRDQWSMLKRTWYLTLISHSGSNNERKESSNSNSEATQIVLKLEKSVSFDASLTNLIKSSLLNLDAKNGLNTLSLHLVPAKYKSKPPSSRKVSHLEKYNLVPIKIALDQALKLWFNNEIDIKRDQERCFTKYHQKRLEQLKQSIKEGYFEYNETNKIINLKNKGQMFDSFYAKYVETYGNDLLYQLWQTFFVVYYDPNVECNIDNFYSSLLYYIGFCDIGSGLYIIPQLKLSNGRSRGDIAVGNASSDSCNMIAKTTDADTDTGYELILEDDKDSKENKNDNENNNDTKVNDESENEIKAENGKENEKIDNKKEKREKKSILNNLYLFMEDKSFEWSNDSKNEIKFGDVTAQLIFGAIESMYYRNQFNDNVFLFRNLGGKITIYKLKIFQGMYEKIMDKTVKIDNGLWQKMYGEHPVHQIDYQLNIFEKKEDFIQLVEIFEKLLLMFAPDSHHKILNAGDHQVKEKHEKENVNAVAQLTTLIDKLSIHD